MRVDKVLMFGVGALGLYAVYRLVSNPKEQPPEHVTPIFPQDQRRPDQVFVPAGTLPDLPGVIPAAPTDIAMVTLDQSPTMRLTPGAWYHGRLETTHQTRELRSIEPSSNAEEIQRALNALGFGNIFVFMTPQEAATDIFQPFALANPGKGTRWFRARLPAFHMDGNPVSPDVVKPPGLVLLWRAAAPASTRATSSVAASPRQQMAFGGVHRFNRMLGVWG